MPGLVVLAIEIPFDPRIITIGGLMLTWHGLFTAIGILAGVQIALWFVFTTYLSVACE